MGSACPVIRGCTATISPGLSASSPWPSTRTGRVGVAGSPPAICRSGFLAVVQATGFEEVIPTGEGVLGFEAADEAASGIETLLSDPDRHAKVAWALAEEYFDSAKVLPRLLEVALG